ncbi:hypothetical protein [Caldichromatium japonicum]|nr:hypothetical protein [Caldichromatium japonicum]
MGALLLRALDSIAALVEQVEPSAGQLPAVDSVLCAELAALVQAAD